MNIANNKSELTLNCGIDGQFILHGAFESNELKRASPISVNDFLSWNPAGVLGKMYRGTVIVPLSAALSFYVCLKAYQRDREAYTYVPLLRRILNDKKK